MNPNTSHTPLAFAEEGQTMETPHLTPPCDAVLKPETRTETLAYWISQVGSPPAMALLTLILLTAHIPYPGAWTWSATYVLLVLILPLSYLVSLLLSGKVTDLDVQLREQRNRPFLATVVGTGTAWGVMLAGDAPPPFVTMAGAAFVQSLMIFLITLKWKISLHTATAAGMTVLILRIIGIAAAPFVVTLPLIAWSRIKLRRHTLKQTVAGILLGSTVFIGAIVISPTL